MVRQNWRLWPESIDVEKILNNPKTQEIEEATTFGGSNLDHRRSRIAWLTGDPQIQQLLLPYIDEAATVLDINVFDQSEVQYTEYHATENGKYDWHHDVDWNNNNGVDRKLSLTVQLSDPNEYEGGDFEFSEVEQVPQNAKLKGSVLIFPSYLVHRVTPVTKGTRKSLVAWYSGATWR